MPGRKPGRRRVCRCDCKQRMCPRRCESGRRGRSAWDIEKWRSHQQGCPRLRGSPGRALGVNGNTRAGQKARQSRRQLCRIRSIARNCAARAAVCRFPQLVSGMAKLYRIISARIRLLVRGAVAARQVELHRRRDDQRKHHRDQDAADHGDRQGLEHLRSSTQRER